METQLLIIKIGKSYIRVKDDAYVICALDKASVFPMERLETVKAHVAAMAKKQGWSGSIYRLVLTEEALDI